MSTFAGLVLIGVVVGTAAVVAAVVGLVLHHSRQQP